MPAGSRLADSSVMTACTKSDGDVAQSRHKFFSALAWCETSCSVASAFMVIACALPSHTACGIVPVPPSAGTGAVRAHAGTTGVGVIRRGVLAERGACASVLLLGGRLCVGVGGAGDGDLAYAFAKEFRKLTGFWEMPVTREDGTSVMTMTMAVRLARREVRDENCYDVPVYAIMQGVRKVHGGTAK